MNIQDLKELPHKPEVKVDDFDIVKPNLRILCYEFVEYCNSRDLPILLTSLVRPMIPGVSKSDSHAQGRAADFSAKGFTIDDCLLLEKYFNENYEKIGAISASDGKARACVFHDVGLGAHFHLQCRP